MTHIIFIAGGALQGYISQKSWYKRNLLLLLLIALLILVVLFSMSGLTMKENFSAISWISVAEWVLSAQITGIILKNLKKN